MTSLNGAEALVRMLQAHGVRHIFGLCGDTSLPFYDALARLDHGMQHILTRDERSAAYMADGYARVARRPGICEGPSGGGATYILPGVVEANESSVPVLAITTDIATTSRGRYTLTELDQGALFRPLTKWNGTANAAADIPRLVRAAFSAMTTGRSGAAHLCVPFDAQKGALDDAELYADPAVAAYPARRSGADPGDVLRAVALLTSMPNKLVIAGGGVVLSGAEPELAEFARLTQAVVATTISGQGSLAETDPACAGVVGSNGGTRETRALVDMADLVIFVGCRAGSVTTERRRHPAPDAARVIHIDADAAVIGANYRTDVGLVGDAKLVLRQLSDALAAQTAFDLPSRLNPRAVADAKARKRAAFLQLALSDAHPIRPERVVHELREVLPPEAIVIADPGTPCPYLSAHFEVRATGRRLFSNRAHGALGYSMAAAVGAHFAAPGTPVVAMMGDGSFGFTAGELETLVRHRVPVVMVVISNATFGWIKAGQKSGFGERYFSVDFGRTDHAAVAAAYGVRSWRVEDPQALRPALRAALECGAPALVDVICQPLHEASAPVSEWVA
ncbi:MAG: thiamine pyrophosphate-binding protein [Burkholderiales bacterium]|nr:thiamine pyrophosphate-binding protein [Burkholderiales bacterium]